MKRKDVLEELGLDDSLLFKFWRVIIKVVVPVVISVLILQLFELLDPLMAFIL
jgi:SNF family Na+-dependent transporter